VPPELPEPPEREPLIPDPLDPLVLLWPDSESLEEFWFWSFCLFWFFWFWLFWFLSCPMFSSLLGGLANA
jgi:hypothetical protein